ncbi:MAG TPA: tagaturonate epimerase family protein [Verrucomicrobiae bacterium]
MLELGKYSFGMGDRFAHQAAAQLRACAMAAERGVQIVPVWNKSNREHITIGSEPPSVRAAADAAVKELGWTRKYHVDADHINLATVDRFIEPSDFFTIDVASSIGKSATTADIGKFVEKHRELATELRIAGVEKPFSLTKAEVERIAAKYLLAVQEAGKIFRHIAQRKGSDNFITEISMDETDAPQTPPELLIILAAIAEEGIPVQTIAPKFTGRFNKGVDYVGDVRQFEQEFSDDVAVISHAVSQFRLPKTLKLSVHSGSDKFSIYPAIRRVLQKTGAGLHIKTAGTTWLEEVIGLAEAGGEGLELAKEIYAEALEHLEELCAPYAAVIDIRPERLPKAEEVLGWSSEQFTGALRHEPRNPAFNPDLRQLLHVGYKIAAKKGERYLGALRNFRAQVSANVTANLYKRHIQPLFG